MDVGGGVAVVVPGGSEENRLRGGKSITEVIVTLVSEKTFRQTLVVVTVPLGSSYDAEKNASARRHARAARGYICLLRRLVATHTCDRCSSSLSSVTSHPLLHTSSHSSFASANIPQPVSVCALVSGSRRRLSNAIDVCKDEAVMAVCARHPAPSITASSSARYMGTCQRETRKRYDDAPLRLGSSRLL